MIILLLLLLPQVEQWEEPNGFYAVDSKYNLYHSNFLYGNVDCNLLQSKFIVLNNINYPRDKVYIDDNWNSFNMGFGKYLLIKGDKGVLFKKFINEYLGNYYLPSELYQLWYSILKYIDKINYY